MTEQKNEYFEKVKQNIKEFGYHFTIVMEDQETTPFGYSTGLFENFKIPELIISGLPPRLTQNLIEQYAQKYKFTKVPTLEIIENLTDRFPVYLTKVSNQKIEDYILSSKWYYGQNNFEYIQLIFPDLNGNFPGGTNYDYDQEIFGEVLKF